MSYSPQRVVVFTPHPDDAEIGTGGTIAKWIKAGAEVTIVCCTNGDKGSADPKMTSARLAAIRKKEQTAAAKVLGVQRVVFLLFRDGEIENSKATRGAFVREIRRARPDVVMTTDPTRRTGYMHHDHRVTGQVAMDACFPYARDHLFYPEHKRLGLKPHKTRFLYLWASEEPDTWVDVADTLELKIEALKRHASQISAQREAEFSQRMREMAKRSGEKAGYEAAEGFRVIEMRL
ncbi:MAG: PIG-L family deacetylase [Chloroflexi bacterium]|nr:PIG-L family deacetylase [Chloroflexota bacterium]